MTTLGRRRRTLRAIASAFLVSGILGAYAFPLAMPAFATGGWSPGALDVAPESETGPIGTTFTLTATVYDHDGDVYAGPGTDTQVRFYFLYGSPNDPHNGSSPDLTCSTGTDGQCSVSYVGQHKGTDHVLGLAMDDWWDCWASQGASDCGRLADMVRRTVTDAPDPDPTPTPTPDPTPTPEPTPTPTPDPTPTRHADAEPTPTPTPDPTPTPEPTPIPTPEPTPIPTPDTDPHARADAGSDA